MSRLPRKARISGEKDYGLDPYLIIVVKSMNKMYVPYVATLLNSKTIFEQHLTRFVVRNIHQKDMFSTMGCNQCAFVSLESGMPMSP